MHVDARGQGHTLVHRSAQLEQFLSLRLTNHKSCPRQAEKWTSRSGQGPIK